MSRLNHSARGIPYRRYRLRELTSGAFFETLVLDEICDFILTFLLFEHRRRETEAGYSQAQAFYDPE